MVKLYMKNLQPKASSVMKSSNGMMQGIGSTWRAHWDCPHSWVEWACQTAQEKPSGDHRDHGQDERRKQTPKGEQLGSIRPGDLVGQSKYQEFHSGIWSLPGR